jgi:hypothetical protein
MTADAGAIVERLLLVLDEGRRTGTHKLALLLGLMDAVEAAADARGGTAPAAVPVAAVGWHIVERLLQQVVPFVPAGGRASDARVLRQMRPNGRGAFVFHDVAVQARGLIDDEGLQGLSALRAQHPDEAADMQRRLVAAAVKNPLPRFQRVGGASAEFLYNWPWAPDTSARRVADEQGRGEPCVEFLPGAAELLLRFAPLLRPLVEARYVSDVGRYNSLDAQESALRDHLFGSERVAFPAALRDGLAELQDHRCLYCEEPLGRARAIDHFVPWVRHPNNAVENLVLTDPRCNSRKSDLLPASVHAQAWVEDIHARRALGAVLAPNHVTVLSDLPRSLAVARRAYASWPEGLPLWREAAPAVRMSDGARAEVLAILDAVPVGPVTPLAWPVAAEDQGRFDAGRSS